MLARRIFLDSWANRPPWPKSIDFPYIQLREVHEVACYQSNFTKRLLNSTSPMHRVFEQIPTSPRQVYSIFPLPSHILFCLLHILKQPQKAVIIFSIIFGVFGLLGILITLGNLILFFAERKDKRQKEETKRESSEGLMLSENVGGDGNPELRINGQRLSMDEESRLEGRQDERLQRWRSEGAERV
jgi:hypothetical protein